MGLSQTPLCATCFGLGELRNDIKKLLNVLDGEEQHKKDVIIETDLAPRIRLLLADSWQFIQSEGHANATRCMSATALKREAPRLRSLLQELEKQMPGMTGTLAPTPEANDAH